MRDFAQTSSAALSANAITKTFPGVRALTDVSIDINAGEIHALLGENGAGKSTLIKVLTGVYRADKGTFSKEGLPVEIDGPRSARALGVTVVPQDIVMVPQLSIGRNIMLGEEGALVRKNAMTPVERDEAKR